MSYNGYMGYMGADENMLAACEDVGLLQGKAGS